MNTNDKVYSILVDGLCLAASSYEAQVKALPEFVHQADEVVNAVESIYVRQLVESGRLTQEQGLAFQKYEQYLETYIVSPDYSDLDPIEQIKLDPWFEKLRVEATEMLWILGEKCHEPIISGVTYVKGA